jgi:cobalt/nickel transport system permease protein
MLLAMHIPDGFLDPVTTVVTIVLAIGCISFALRRLRIQEGDRLVPLVGVVAAGIFAAQMVNVPLVGVQASGHLLGGVLAGVVLGPAGGAVALTAVLFIQCFMFGDGGVTALGANILNMAVINAVGGYALYAVLRRMIGGPRGTVVAAVAASWLIIPVSALAFALEISARGDVPFRPVATLMLFYHVLIGFGEAVVTGLVTAWLLRVRPDLIYGHESAESSGHRYGRVLAGGLTLGLAIAVFAAPFASEMDDALETVALRVGFGDQAREVAFAPFPDYHLSDAAAGAQPTQEHVLAIARGVTSALGVLGTMLTWGFATAVGNGVRAARSNRKLYAP